jgi:hypothetical protein
MMHMLSGFWLLCVLFYNFSNGAGTKKIGAGKTCLKAYKIHESSDTIQF